MGSSEEIVGRALKKYARREDIVLATKVHFKMHDGPGGSGLSRKAIMEQIDASLSRLDSGLSTSTRSTASIPTHRSRRPWRPCQPQPPGSASSCAWQHALVSTVRPAVQRKHPPDALMRLVNPMVRRMVARGRLGDQVLLLHYVGRRSGRRFDVPAGYHLIDGLVSVFTSSGWRHNFAGGRDIEVTLRGIRQPARAMLWDDPDEVVESYQRLVGAIGTDRARRSLGLRSNVDRAPTREELRDAIQRSGLSVVRIDAPLEP